MSRLPDEQIVVRGGLLGTGDLENGANLHDAMFGCFGWSVYSVRGMTPPELLRAVDGDIPHRNVVFSSVGRLRANGFEVKQSGAPKHFTAYHPDERDLEFLVVQFRTAFTLPVARNNVDEVRVD